MSLGEKGSRDASFPTDSCHFSSQQSSALSTGPKRESLHKKKRDQCPTSTCSFPWVALESFQDTTRPAGDSMRPAATQVSARDLALAMYMSFWHARKRRVNRKKKKTGQDGNMKSRTKKGPHVAPQMAGVLLSGFGSPFPRPRPWCRSLKCRCRSGSKRQRRLHPDAATANP